MSELEVTRVMSDLRGLYERGKLSDEQIARLDAIGFNWERKKRIKPTLDSRLAELWDEEKNGAVELVRLKHCDRYVGANGRESLAQHLSRICAQCAMGAC